MVSDAGQITIVGSITARERERERETHEDEGHIDPLSFLSLIHI